VCPADAGHTQHLQKIGGFVVKLTFCIVSSFVVADNFVLRNRQLLVAANRCASLSKIGMKNEKFI
jgi:hypothetical protein